MDNFKVGDLVKYSEAFMRCFPNRKFVDQYKRFIVEGIQPFGDRKYLYCRAVAADGTLSKLDIENGFERYFEKE